MWQLMRCIDFARCSRLSATRERMIADWPAAPLWPALIAQADTHRVLPALAVALERNRLMDRVDEEPRELLVTVADWNAERNEGLKQQLLRLGRAFNANGLEPVWLKGALSLLSPDGPASGRLMLDLDVWIPAPGDQEIALRTLETMGYAFAAERMRATDRMQHYPPHFHPSEMARVELHRSIVAARHRAWLPPEEAARGIERIACEDTRVGRLDPLSRALCSFAQCTRPDYTLGQMSQIPLMKALDFVAWIHGDFGGAIPDALVERVTRTGWEDCARPVLTMTETLFGIKSPFPQDHRLMRTLERALRMPHWNFVILTTAAVFGTPGRNLLREPGRIPRALGNALKRLRASGRIE